MPTSHPRIMKGHETSLSWPEVEEILDQIDKLSHLFDCYGVRDVLLKAPLGYNPSDEINDLVWNQSHANLVNDQGLSANESVPSAKVVPISGSPKKLA